jgi:serine phosphatase RsbU (regulator of sigma subunit)
MINKYFKLIPFLLCFLLLSNYAFANRKDTLIDFTGKVYENKIDTDKKITYKNAIFKLVKTSVDFFVSNTADKTIVNCILDNKIVFSDTVKSDGVFSIPLNYDNNYRIEFIKDDYYVSSVAINTAGVPQRLHKKGIEIHTELDVIKKHPKQDQFKFDMMKIAFNQKDGVFKVDDAHSKYVLEELELIRINLTKTIAVEKEVNRLSEETRLKLINEVEQEKKKAKAEGDLLVENAKLKADSIINYAEVKSQEIEQFTSRQFTPTNSSLRKDSSKTKTTVDFSNGADMGLIMGGSIELTTKKDQVENARKSLELAKLKATTKMDSLLIIEREAKILAAENAILIAEQKLKDAEKEISAQNAELEMEKLLKKIMIFGLLGLIVLAVIFFRIIKQKKKDNKIIMQQKLEVEEQHKEITDSINYAERIQAAVLTSEDEWDKISKEHFVLFKPRDIVSGDFFWAHHNEEKNISIWATADCTGHGVPGAFMSMLGIGFLNEIVIENGIIKPDEILNDLRSKIIKALVKNKADIEQKDGMDISLCILDKNTNTLEFSGANNSIWILKNHADLSTEEVENSKTIIHPTNEKAIIEIKADKQPVGAYVENIKPFKTSHVKLNKDDVIISFTDGYPDQFGGVKGKKLKYKPFKQFFLDNSSHSLENLKMNLEHSFNDWKGDLEQIDDVCVVAVKV